MSLKQNLIDLIKTHGRLTHREVVQYCLDNGYKPDNGTRRLREVVEADPTIVPEKHAGTIMAYTYQPSSMQQEPTEPDIKPIQTTQNTTPAKSPHSEPVFAPRGKSYYFREDTDEPCCQIFAYNQIDHSRGCKFSA